MIPIKINNNNHMNLVTVKSSHYQTDLIVLKSKLESEGISCFFKNELTTQVLNHLPSFLIELQVPETELSRVKEVMAEIGESTEFGVKLICGSCGSERIKMKLGLIKRVQLFFAVIWVMLVNNLPADKLFKESKYFCKDCGTEVIF
jgi:hypothetical protein